MAIQEQTLPDEGRVREETGWAPVRHFAGRSALGLAAVVAVGLGFGLLLLLVRFNWGPLQSLDTGVAQGLNDLFAPRPGLVKVLDGITQFGGRPVLFWVVGVGLVLLLARRRTRLAAYLAITGIGALLLDPALKALVGRLRPVVDLPVASAPGNSFPSGHALGSMIVYGAVILVFLPAVRQRWRPVFIAVPMLLVALIGFTRIALGVHYLSDVLAGWLLGAAWLGVTAYAFRVWRREAGHPDAPITDGLEPEAAEAIKPAPDEDRMLPHPWVKGAEILTGWALIFGLLFALGWVFKWAEDSPFGRADNGVVGWLQGFRTSGLDQVSYVWSKAGDTHAILLISLAFCPIALALWRRWRPVLFLVLTMVGELTLFLCAAAAVQRPRPPFEQLDGQMPTSSFPSGHIAATMCVWVAIALLVTGRVQAWWRWIFVALAVIMPVGVALSRMYRGMHHPTDAFGALVLTTCWIGLLYWVIRPNEDVTKA